MDQKQPPDQGGVIREDLRSPRAAGVAGIIFAILLGLAIVLVRLAVPSEPSEVSAVLSDSDARGKVEFALNLMPFAGIAFLWFIGVIRDRVGVHEDRLFATVFLGSGLLFVAMLFTAAAVAGGTIAAGNVRSASEYWAQGHNITLTLLDVYAMRMGAVFCITTANMARRARVLPRWLAVSGYATGLIVLIAGPWSRWVTLLMPLWVLSLSVYLLLRPERE